jgi:hypothetical protein
MHKCHLTADCEIGNQTNRIAYLNIDLTIEPKCKYWVIQNNCGYLATMYENLCGNYVGRIELTFL